MTLSVIFSKPTKDAENLLGRKYEKIKIRIQTANEKIVYFAEMFTKTQVFHQRMTEFQVLDFIEKYAGTAFKNCIHITDEEEITILTNKRGEKRTLRHKRFFAEQNAGQISKQSSENIEQNKSEISSQKKSTNGSRIAEKNVRAGNRVFHLFPPSSNANAMDSRKKNYIIQEGEPVNFLVLLGIMTESGKVLSSKYSKFRQINRFLEFIDDIAQDVINQKFNQQDVRQAEKNHHEKNNNENDFLHIVDFGCGKSYLTFAVYYYFSIIKNIPVKIHGLDLRSDVVESCNVIAHKLNFKELSFSVGDIADYNANEPLDILITLHACDTATDYALLYGARHNCSAILSVPCCQHEVNAQLQKRNKKQILDERAKLFEPFLKYGIVKEHFATLVTDLCRADFLERSGYSVQLLEFIDSEYTAKNILIRAVKKNANKNESVQNNTCNATNENIASADTTGENTTDENMYNTNYSLAKKTNTQLLASALNINPCIYK